MSSLVRLMVIATALWAGSNGRASAQLRSTDQTTLTSVDDSSTEIAVETSKGTRVTRLRKGELLAPAEVPELDPNAAGLALALLMGGALISIDRRRQRAA